LILDFEVPFPAGLFEGEGGAAVDLADLVALSVLLALVIFLELAFLDVALVLGLSAFLLEACAVFAMTILINYNFSFSANNK